MHFLIVSPLSRCPSEVILSTHTVVSGYSSSLAISSQEQPLPRSVGGHLRTDRGKEADAERGEDIYNSDNSEAELHPNVCSFMAGRRKDGMSLCRATAGSAGLRLSRCVSVSKSQISHTWEVLLEKSIKYWLDTGYSVRGVLFLVTERVCDSSVPGVLLPGSPFCRSDLIPCQIRVCNT